MRPLKLLTKISLLLLIPSISFAQPAGKGFVAVSEEDGSPICFGWQTKFANGNVTDNGDGTCSIADQTGAGGGDAVLIDGVAVADASGVDLIGGTTGIDVTFNAVASPDTATWGLDLTEITCGAGLACASATAIATDSTEASFLASGALTCGAGTAGKIQVHTTPIQYCDNAATPALQYAAYGSSTGVATSATALAADPADCGANAFATTIAASGALTCASIADADVPNTITIDLATVATTATTANAGDSATAFFASGTLEVAIGGTGTTTSTGTGAVVLGTSPTFTTDITFPALSVEAGALAAASVDGDDINSNLAGRSLTLTAASPDTLDSDAELYTDTKCLYWENPVAADDFKTIWTTNIAATITGITCESDQTVVFDLQVDDGTPTGVNGSDITCTTFARDGTLAGDTTMASGDRLDMAVTSVSGTPTWASVCFDFTYDD